MTETDLSDWLLTMEAAMRIGCSIRTIERLGRARKLEARLRPQKGSPPVVVYNPDDVARIARERHPAPAPFVLGAIPTSHDQSGNGRALVEHKKFQPGTNPVPGDDLIRQFFVLAVQALQSPPSPPVAEKVAERPAYVDKTAALAIAGVSYGALRAAVQAGEVKQRGRRYRRTDLEAL
jgi:hypothetical protein